MAENLYSPSWQKGSESPLETTPRCVILGRWLKLPESLLSHLLKLQLYNQFIKMMVHVNSACKALATGYAQQSIPSGTAATFLLTDSGTCRPEVPLLYASDTCLNLWEPGTWDLTLSLSTVGHSQQTSRFHQELCFCLHTRATPPPFSWAQANKTRKITIEERRFIIYS